jgi:hypothetical protein
MIRSTIALLACALWPAMAQAQEQSTLVYFEPLKGGELAPLNKAVQAALSEPPLQLAEKPGPHVLLVSVPNKVEISHKEVSGTSYSFTIAFSRDGSALGESLQDCNAAKLSDCTDQIVLDVKSAAAPR